MSLKKANKRFDFVVSAKQCVNKTGSNKLCLQNRVNKIMCQANRVTNTYKSSLTCPTKVTHNEPGLALLGYLKKRQPTTEAQYLFKS